MSTSYSALRRSLAQRMNYWGGNIQSNGPGIFNSTGTTNTVVDTSRPEPDGEWDDAWIVLNPGSSDQTNAPTTWRRVAPDSGWISSTGTFTIMGTWPSPYNAIGPSYASGTSTGTTTSTLTDGTATWTTNQWKGHTITVGSSTAYVLSNTSTVLTLTSTGWTGGTPALGSYTITITYEVYKIFRPENWLQAINWAIANSYPKRHVAANFELAQESQTRIVPWGQLVKSLSVSDPTGAPTVTEINDNTGKFMIGTYTFGYTYYNDLGETLVGTTSTLAVAHNNARIQFAAINSIPAAAKGINYYGSIQPNDTQLGQLPIGEGFQPSSVTSGSQLGQNLNGTADIVQFSNPYSGVSTYPPIYNTTNVDVQDLFHILKRVNPGQYPEIWNDLGSDLYKPMGDQTIMLMYLPLGNYNLKFICGAIIPPIISETGSSAEPQEMLFAGGEHYLWSLLTKTSTIVNVNWDKLAMGALAKYESLKGNYAMEVPRTNAYRPVIRTQYAFLPFLPLLYTLLERLVEHKSLLGL